MDIFRKNLSPVSSQAWEEINEQAKIVFNTSLSARKFVDVDGPRGFDFGAVTLGRLDIPKDQKGDVKYGVHQVQPMVEARIPFELDIWELDNAARGAEDIDLESLENAASKIAKFEEDLVYNGFPNGQVKGLKQSSGHPVGKYPQNPEELLRMVSDALAKFKDASVDGPYTLIVDTRKWNDIASFMKGYPLISQLDKLLGGGIITAPKLDNQAFIVSERGGDFKLTLGTDLAIGYEGHNPQKVQLFLTESLTFQVLDENAVMVFE